ncbi:RNA-binding protein [Aphanizomenon flos-aquae]|jgi:ribosomal protein S1|uniref:RNA-binding protein n=1 Tax=Aphanizomenon flos-aquae TaxID=1176 RepID=UPI001F54C16E|nr:RNA-binding protein [Aphanizomenon flos-aquae]
MDSTSSENIKSKYKLGQFVLGKVEFHTPFGVFVNIDDSLVKGLIKIPDFLDEGGMTEEMYPEIGATVGAVVVTKLIAIPSTILAMNLLRNDLI